MRDHVLDVLPRPLDVLLRVERPAVVFCVPALFLHDVSERVQRVEVGKSLPAQGLKQLVDFRGTAAVKLQLHRSIIIDMHSLVSGR